MILIEIVIGFEHFKNCHLRTIFICFISVQVSSVSYYCPIFPLLEII